MQVYGPINKEILLQVYGPIKSEFFPEEIRSYAGSQLYQLADVCDVIDNLNLYRQNISSNSPNSRSW